MKYLFSIFTLLCISITGFAFNTEDEPVRPFVYAIESREDNVFSYDLRVIDLNNPQDVIFSLSTDEFDCGRGLSPDGQYLMYSQGGFHPSLQTGYLLNLTTLETIPQPVGIWSANSQYIAQIVLPNEDQAVLTLYDVTMETSQLIFEEQGTLSAMQWADDNNLVFVHRDNQSRYTLYMVNVLSNNLTEIFTSDNRVNNVQWTGDRLIFTEHTQESVDIYTWDDGTLARHFENQLQSGTSPLITFSPNGNYAIYRVTATLADDRTERQSYLLNLITGTIRSDVTLSNPVWHPDGNLLAYHQDQRVYLLDLITDETILIRNNSRHYGKTWSPDGRYLSYKTSNEIDLYDLQTETSFSIIEVLHYELSADGWVEWLSDTEFVYTKAIGDNVRVSNNSSDIVFYDLETDTHTPLTTTTDATYSCIWG